MSNFPFNNSIPATNNNPSDDQPEMLINNISNDGIWDVDHLGFDTDNGGTHIQNSYGQYATPSLIPGATSSVAYPASGIADATHAQYYFKNPLATFLLSGIRAFASFTTGTMSVPGTLLNGSNVTFAQPTNSSYTLTLPVGLVVTSGSVGIAVFITSSNGSAVINWSFTNPVLTLTSSVAPGTNISVMIVQI